MRIALGHPTEGRAMCVGSLINTSGHDQLTDVVVLVVTAARSPLATVTEVLTVS